MCSLIKILILVDIFMYSIAVYLGEQANYDKPRLERNNILNKGQWMKDKIEKSHYGNFIFRADSGDVDNLLQNNFDAFGENFMDAIPVFSSYVERNKRSTIHKQNQRLRKSLRKCKDKMNCSKKDEDKQTLMKSKFISQLRPATVFNDYPYEVAVLIANSNKRDVHNNEITKSDVGPKTEIDKKVLENQKENSLIKLNKTYQHDFEIFDENSTKSHNKIIFTIPKRRMIKTEFDMEKKEKTPVETNNKTKYIDGNKINRNIFDKEEKMWQTAPIQNMIFPRPENSVNNKPVTEKGLVKVLSLLTKTFRKVIKQHNEIQEIDSKLHSLNEDFMKNVAILDTKFQDFDTKYTHLIEINQQMESLNEKFIKKNYDLEHRETEISKSFKEFENQQKKFLLQQHQFYTIQKFMLDQNERINRKQNLIAKTQSEISHRQNHFARVLKKAKQFYLDKKMVPNSKLSSVVNKERVSPNNKLNNPHGGSNNITVTTPVTPISTDSVKINLFSIPNIAPLLDHDKLILEEKNEQPVDDLVYKYYFNNTFIDNLMKSKVLTAIVDNEVKNTRNIKNKRNGVSNETTILLPISYRNEYSSTKNLRRERRWIRHPNKISKKMQGKDIVINEKLRRSPKDSRTKENENKNQNDPFMTMAINFCIEVGQNKQKQMLNWCVEKSLRKLKSIDMTLPMKPSSRSPQEKTPEKIFPFGAAAVNPVPETTKIIPLKMSTQIAEPVFTSSPANMFNKGRLQSSPEDIMITEKTSNMFFPDNDELESNLKQYELKPDPEGTVYFDGSLHTSDIVISESDALSDIMPGLDSNSHVDVDPMALDLQARRRAYVRRYNENILKKIHS